GSAPHRKWRLSALPADRKADTSLKAEKFRNRHYVRSAGLLQRNEKRALNSALFVLSPQQLFCCCRGCCLLAGTADQLFLDACRLAGTLTQVIQFGTTYVTAAFHFDASDQRGVQLESTLHA